MSSQKNLSTPRSDMPPLTSNMWFSSSRSCSSYASILRGKILGSSRGIPFEDTPDGEMLAPGNLSSQSPELQSVWAGSASTRSDLQIDNSTQALNGGGASDNSLREGGSTVDQQAVVSDQVNNINAESDGLDDFLAYMVNRRDFINNGDSFILGDQDFAP
uniref:Uncharacterized protein n=3 Tax=Zea mays TaxID=4577 RepID=A0A804UAR3_MAIZE